MILCLVHIAVEMYRVSVFDHIHHDKDEVDKSVIQQDLFQSEAVFASN